MTDSHSASPEALLIAARNNGGDWLGQLLQLYSNYLKVLASTQLDTKLRGRVSPSDVVQDTLLEAHRDFDGFRGSSEKELMGWLRRILLNNVGRLVEHHILAAKRNVGRERSLERMHCQLERSSIQLRALVADQRRSPISDVERREDVRFLSDQLALLADDHREVVVLRNLEGLSFKEVAARMQRSHGATRMLWLRAIESLRQRFDEAGLL